jgi:NAD(P)-dependent dehydrogenase (short-subunit alcohol dehydrogenase family)
MSPTPPLAWVTGASRGIGRALVRCLHDRGWQVVASARSTDALNELRSTLGPTVHPRPLDVSDPAAVTALAAEIEARLGPIALLVNDAATMDPIGSFVSQPLAAWTLSLHTNLLGVAATMHAALPAMIERRAGVVINLSSGASRHPVPNLSAYCASKAALDQLTRTVAAELRAHGVRVHGLYPGLADTPMQDHARRAPPERTGQALRDTVHAYAERGLLHPPQRAAQAICWLAETGPHPDLVDLDAPGVWEAVEAWQRSQPRPR